MPARLSHPPSSVSFDSLTPARLALRANLQLLHLAFPKRSIVVNPSPSSAFTLIELLVTITVIAILAGLTLAAVGGVNQKASRDKTKAEIAAISNALEQFKSVRDDYPTNSDTNNFYPIVLTNNINSIGPFFIANKISTNASNQLLDPYGYEYQYKKPGDRNPASFDVFSKGKDGAANTSDDIGNW